MLTVRGVQTHADSERIGVISGQHGVTVGRDDLPLRMLYSFDAAQSAVEIGGKFNIIFFTFQEDGSPNIRLKCIDFLMQFKQFFKIIGIKKK